MSEEEFEKRIEAMARAIATDQFRKILAAGGMELPEGQDALAEKFARAAAEAIGLSDKLDALRPFAALTAEALRHADAEGYEDGESAGDWYSWALRLSWGHIRRVHEALGLRPARPQPASAG